MKGEAEHLRAIAESYLALLEDLDENHHRDVEALVALMSDDVEYEIPFLGTPLKLNGRDAVHDFLTGAQGKFADVSYDVDRWLVDAEQQVVILEMRAERTILPDMERYGNRYVLIFTLRDGKIADFREYLNPIAAAKMSERMELE